MKATSLGASWVHRHDDVIRQAVQRGLYNRLDQLPMAPTGELGKDHQVAGFWVQAGQRIDFEKVRDSRVQAEVEARDIAAAERPMSQESRLGNTLQDAGRQPGGAFIDDLTAKI